MKLWDLGGAKPKLLGEALPSEAGGFNGRSWETQLAVFSPSDTLLAYQRPAAESESGISEVVLYDYQSLQPMMALPDAGSVFGFSPDGRLLATGVTSSTGNDIKIWDARTGTFVRSMGAISWLACEFLDNDGRIATSLGKQVQIWDTRSGDQIQIRQAAREQIYGI